MRDFQARIRPAATTDELEQLYKLRAQVFYGEDILRRSPTSSLRDELDDVASTVNLVVISSAQEVVGGVRMTFPEGCLVPARTPYFDFVSMLPEAGRTTASGSMFCLRPEYRHTLLASLLARSAMYVGLRMGATHICASVRPMIVRFFLRLGWVEVASEFDHPVELVPVVPMIVDLQESYSEQQLQRAVSPTLELDAIAEVVRASSG